MALSHNSFIRGYNSIYQQAPRIKETDQGDFIAYCLAWHAVVEEHHDYEETRIFPAIEKALGQKGLFDHELEQHGRFEFFISYTLIYSIFKVEKTLLDRKKKKKETDKQF